MDLFIRLSSHLFVHSLVTLGRFPWVFCQTVGWLYSWSVHSLGNSRGLINLLVMVHQILFPDLWLNSWLPLVSPKTVQLINFKLDRCTHYGASQTWQTNLRVIEYLSFPGLWLVQQFLHISGQTSRDWPQTWWVDSLWDSPGLINTLRQRQNGCQIPDNFKYIFF